LKVEECAVAARTADALFFFFFGFTQF
jgi:hypothetical protein